MSGVNLVRTSLLATAAATGAAAAAAARPLPGGGAR